MLKAQTPGQWLLALTMVGLVACGGDDAESGDDSGAPADDASDGGSNADTDAGDDTQLPDGGEPDGGTPDAELPDTGVPDSETPDAEVPDTDPGVDGTMDTEDIDAVDTGDADTVDADAEDAVAEDITPDADPPDLGPSDAGTDTSTGCTAPSVGDLLINEILPSPATGNSGDANCDGTRNAVDDEFVELVNASGRCLDLSGVYLVVESGGVRFTFETGTELVADAVAVVFGGGEPAFDGTSTQTLVHCNNLSPCDIAFFTAAPGSLALAPEDRCGVAIGETVLDEVTWGAGGLELTPGVSLTRTPEITGAFGPHTLTASARLMSPGTDSAGGALATCRE